MNKQPSSSQPDVLGSLAKVSARTGFSTLADRLNELRNWLATDLDILERSIADAPADSFDRAPMGDLAARAQAHLIQQPGKRLRPLCVVLAARMGGRDMDAAVRGIATASELIHAATLLHDDVMDEGTDRRGAPTARLVYGNSASVLAGDHLLLYALQSVDTAGDPVILSSALATISRMVAAETLQLDRRERFEPSREDYLSVIHGKTAALFEWSLRSGGRAGGLSDDLVNRLGCAGNALGMAFQLVDDILDLDGDPEVLGKDLFADLADGKLTWPLIVASEKDPSLVFDIQACIDRGGADATTVIESVRAHGAIEATKAFALEQADVALDALAGLPESQARRALEVVVETAVHRAK